MVPPTHLAGANTEQERGHGKSSDTNKKNSHYNATYLASQRPEKRQPTPRSHGIADRLGSYPGSLPVTTRPTTGVTFVVPAGQRPGAVSAQAPARLDRTAFSHSGRWSAR